jgi:hypothetical protein
MPDSLGKNKCSRECPIAQKNRRSHGALIKDQPTKFSMKDKKRAMLA